MKGRRGDTHLNVYVGFQANDVWKSHIFVVTLHTKIGN